MNVAPRSSSRRKRLVDVVDGEHERADALGVLAQVAPGAPALAERLVDDERRVARAEGRRALAPLALELGPAAAELGEVELVDEEAPRALEVVDVVVERLDLPDAERGQRRLTRIYFTLRGLTASGCASGCAAWKAGSAAQAASTRARVG